MPCYIWRNKEGKITAYDQSAGYRPPPAIEVTVEEFKKLGFYIPDPPPQEPEPAEESPTPLSALLEGIDTV